MKKKNYRVIIGLIFIPIFMFFLTFASVPLYKLFCQVTGFGGTPKINNIQDEIKITQKDIKIEFNSDINKKLNWYFKPVQRSINIKIGDSVLAFYKVKNKSNKSVSGTATYNIIPFEAAQYFNKVDCFCFENQTLGPNEEAVLPVNFFIDPKILDDPSVNHLKSIVLSYTFFESQDNLEEISKN